MCAATEVAAYDVGGTEREPTTSNVTPPNSTHATDIARRTRSARVAMAAAPTDAIVAEDHPC
jgi:hypothetical protein